MPVDSSPVSRYHDNMRHMRHIRVSPLGRCLKRPAPRIWCRCCLRIQGNRCACGQQRRHDAGGKLFSCSLMPAQRRASLPTTYKRQEERKWKEEVKLKRLLGRSHFPQALPEAAIRPAKPKCQAQMPSPNAQQMLKYSQKQKIKI